MSDRPTLLVTGASRGIGAATAIAGARAGYDVAINYLSNEAAAASVAAAAESAGARAVTIRADTGSEADIGRLFAAVDREFGRLDALVNNAGVLGTPMTVDAIDAEALQRMLGVNVAGYFLCLREAARRMKASGGGAIVNLGSRLSALGGAGGFTVYAATKGAIDSLTVGAARELAGAGIRVNCVSPGVIDTEIHASAGMPDRPAQLASQIPMGRSGSAEDVAEAIIWLLSDRAAYITGAILPVSGGR